MVGDRLGQRFSLPARVDRRGVRRSGGHRRVRRDEPLSADIALRGKQGGLRPLARAWQRTYGRPVIVTNTCNNYGPYQIREKLKRGRVGETYAIGANETHANCAVVEGICAAIDAVAGSGEPSTRRLIAFVADRPAHDYRYAVDPAKVMREFGWRPSRSFADGLKQTVDWYLANEAWWLHILAGGYEAERLGLQGRTAAAR